MPLINLGIRRRWAITEDPWMRHIIFLFPYLGIFPPILYVILNSWDCCSCIGVNCWGEQLISRQSLNHDLPNVKLVSNGQILTDRGNWIHYTPKLSIHWLEVLKQYLVSPNDHIAVRPTQVLNVRAQQIAEFSGSSESQDRLGHRAKEKLLDRVGGRSLPSSSFLC